jgi:stage II sporulation protein P
VRQRFLLSVLLLVFCFAFVLSRTGGAPESTEPPAPVGPPAVTASTEQPREQQQPQPAALPAADDAPQLIGLNDIIFRPGLNDDTQAAPVTENVVMDFDYLMGNLFNAPKETGVLESDLDADKLLSLDMKLNGGGGPKILIFHTHSMEGFSDSGPTDPMEGIMGVGRFLSQLLNEKYGIETLHHTGRYDFVNGKSQRSGAYEVMEPDIRRVLSENPSIEMAIDVHRDGLNAGVPAMVESVNGKRTAKIMFVLGMCRENRNGVIRDAPGLSSPYVFENTALALKAQLAANELFPGFTRRIYMNPYRYSLHMLPKSMLVEVGSQYNTKREALNAAEALAEVLARVVK